MFQDIANKLINFNKSKFELRALEEQASSTSFQLSSSNQNLNNQHNDGSNPCC
jgi:hypothetical protein